jgi:hypothetical protein
MPVPAFSISGVLPPFVGEHGPGGAPTDLTPYAATAVDVIERFATTNKRIGILRGWLEHRRSLRAAGFDKGFQWLDGSFVEDKEPNDLDIVSFLRRPTDAATAALLGARMVAHAGLFQREVVKADHQLDAFFVDIDGDPETLVDHTRYWLGLFSHRRTDAMWKGMVQVRLEEDEAAALVRLEAAVQMVAGAAAAEMLALEAADNG